MPCTDGTPCPAPRPRRPNAANATRRPHRLLGCVAFAMLASGPACGTSAHGTEPCRRIEYARCARIPSCPDWGIGKDGVEGCVAFVRDNCQHGLGVPDPAGPDLEACVGAIRSEETDCEQVRHPETIPACGFLKPGHTEDAGEADADAAASADASDAPLDSTDATDATAPTPQEAADKVEETRPSESDAPSPDDAAEKSDAASSEEASVTQEVPVHPPLSPP